jgi:hypothetical protein
MDLRFVMLVRVPELAWFFHLLAVERWMWLKLTEYTAVVDVQQLPALGGLLKLVMDRAPLVRSTS